MQIQNQARGARVRHIVLILGVFVFLLVGSHAPIARANTPTAHDIPVVFLPGIGGTRLADASNTEYWTAAGYAIHDKLSLYPNPPPLTMYPTNVITEATFLGIHIPSEDWETYGPILTYLQSQDFVMYQTYQDPNYQTSAGCDLTQKANNPNLFVFAYDWRISNADNAVKLADYIACVRKFYPGTNVNLVAHSMGGLVARRYILDNPGTHHVNAYVSVSIPFIGAGKVVWVEETGDYVSFVWASTMLAVIGSFNGASELLPSQAWYDLGGASPLIEDGQDLLNDGSTDEKLTYAQLVQYMNSAKGKQGFTPGTANKNFHNFSSGGNTQDDWRNDTTGVKYFHITGTGSQPDTISQVVAASLWKCLKHVSICNLSTWMYPNMSTGDQTVPYLSLSRQGNNLDYNAPGATLYTCQAVGANSQHVNHNGLLSNPVVQNLLIQYLAQANGAPAQPPPDPTTCGNGGNTLSAQTTSAGYHRLILSGVSDVEISDDTADQFPDGAMIYRMNADSYTLLLARGKTYNVAFNTTDAPLFVEWLYHKNKKPTHAARYLDLNLPPNVRAHFVLSDKTLSDISYDSDNDTAYDAQEKPTVALRGKPARDVREPVVTISTGPASPGMLITLSAQDAASEIAQIVYSTDGQHFEKYTGAFVAGTNVSRIYAFADDAAGNRSKMFEFDLE